MEKLPPLHSEIMSHRVSGLSVQDISALVGRTPHFVRQTLQRLTSISISDHRREVLLTVENARLDALTKAHWGDAVSGDRQVWGTDADGEPYAKSASSIDSAKLILQISKQKAALNGIAAPVEMTTNVNVQVSLIEALRTNSKVIEHEASPVAALALPVPDDTPVYVASPETIRDEAKERFTNDREKEN